MKHLVRTVPSLLALSIGVSSAVSSADNENSEDAIETITVHGRALKLIGDTKAASSGVVGYADFEDRPFSRVGELVEVIPGAVATQHSGEGKANQYFLRGFNLDHGTDFSAHVDGVPVNLRTHGHGQGYLDLNFVIPEIVERVDYRKGPYSPETGDFSSAGSAQYSTYEQMDQSFVEFTIGEFGYYRGVGASSLEVADDTTLLFALEGAKHNGPWVLDQNLEKINVFSKLTHRTPNWHLNLTASAYDSSWSATDQVPERAIENGTIDRFGFIDGDLGGDTTRLSLSLQARHQDPAGTSTEISAYAVSYDFSLFSNFTFFLDDPINGDEFEQIDERSYYGGSVTHERQLDDQFTLRVGAEGRFDNITDVGLFRTAARQRLSTVRRDRVDQLSLSAWGEVQIHLTDRLRATAGLRADYYDADVGAISLPANSGSADDSLLSPSFALAWRASENIEFYANYGQGFHSNDVRGATISVDPNSGEPVDPVPILVRSKGAEFGARFEYERITATVALFTLDLASELVFVGDAGTTEANDASTRYGVETSLFWRPNDWLVLDASAAWTDAEFDISGDETRIPGAVKRVLGGGMTAKLEPWTISARLRHFGAAPLIEDGSVFSEPTTLLNLAVTYDWRPVTLTFELLNVFDANDADISYFFASQLPGETSPVEDIHFHPVEPRQVRASLRYSF